MVDDQRFGLIAGRYRLGDQLGRGGMGRVWFAHDEMLGRDVAIKELAPPVPLPDGDDTPLRAAILREARAAGRINHPNVVKIHDVIETDGWPWLVMEYVPSVDLQKTVDERGPLPPGEVARIGVAVLDALVAAHDAGVLHRDVKPANVLLCDNGRVVLGDFGLATIDVDGKATLAGALGTPQFLAPERVRHGISSHETDLWSLGATLYAAVEGRSPYARDSMLETLSALAVDDPDPMRRAGPLQPVLSGLLRRDPADRTRPEQLADQLRRIAAGMAAVPDTAPKSVRVKRVLLSGALAMAAATGTATIVLNSHNGGAKTSLTGLPTGRPVPAIGIPGCETPRTRIPPQDPTQTRPRPSLETMPQAGAVPPAQIRQTSGPGVPHGWVLHWDPAGFTLAVPQNWEFWRLANSTVCFKGPDGNRILGVMPNRPKAESLQDYREISQKEVQLNGRAIEWEFTYLWRDRKRHAIAIVQSDRTLFWITDDIDFLASRVSYYVVRAWFDADGPRPSFSP